jgi:hypothetical protein
VVRTFAHPAVVLALVGFISACSNPEPPQPVGWYLAHSNERKVKVAWCRDDAARRATPDCQNAVDADQREALGTMKDTAPIDWNAPDKKP